MIRFHAVLALALASTSCGEVTTNGNDNPPPTIEALTPDRGGVPGGHTITVTGSGFTRNDAGDNYVIVGEIAATDVVAEDDATLTFKLPPGPAPDAVLDLTVFNSNGFAVLPDAIQYSPYPNILSLSTSFVRSGGDDLTIIGTGFEAFDAGDPTVTIGNVEAESVEVVSDTEISVEVAPRPDNIAAFQPLDVVVTNANGVARLEDAFKYTKPGLLRFDWTRNVPGTTTISFIDLDDEEAPDIEITSFPFPVEGAALSNNGRIYVIAQGQNRRNGGGRTLAIVDPLTGATQFIGPMEGSPQEDIREIAFIGGNLYGFMNASRQLALVDPDDGSYNIIGAQFAYPEAGGCCGGIVLGMARRNDTSLWAGSYTNGTLYRVSTSDSTAVGQVTMTGETGAGIYNMAQIGGELYAVTRGSAFNGEVGQSVVRIDTTTGALTLVKQFNNGLHSVIVPTPPLF